jgi:predicted DsbA family dithiol-disulfide isomerase
VATLDFYFDPGCPWTWITSRWITSVAPLRDLHVKWRPYSLLLKNRDRDLPTHLVARGEISLGALRMIEAVRAAHGDDPIGSLYTELGTRLHHDDSAPNPTFLQTSLRAARLNPALAAAAQDADWDEPILAAMREASRCVGDDVGSPVLVFDTRPRRGIWGPLLSPAPTGDAALRLWDHLRGALDEPGFYELKRGHNGPPRLPRRPLALSA